MPRDVDLAREYEREVERLREERRRFESQAAPSEGGAA